MSIQEYAAAALSQAAEDLVSVAMALPEDRREWRPLDKGRTALSQIAECAVINEASAQVITTGVWNTNLPVMTGRQAAALNTFDKAAAALREATAILVQAVRNAPDADLGKEITLPWESVTLAELFLIPLWNMSYHEGQITYIGVLAG